MASNDIMCDQVGGSGSGSDSLPPHLTSDSHPDPPINTHSHTLLTSHTNPHPLHGIQRYHVWSGRREW